MDISLFEEKYNAHSILFNHTRQEFEKAQIKPAFPISNEVLSNLALRIENIFNGILDAARTDNLYSVFILYRSLLEHFYKSMYIHDKMLSDRSDTTAENYKKHYFISEFLAEKAGVLEMEDLINESEAKTDFLEFIKKKYPELEDFDKSNQQEISGAIKQFSLKEIIKHLHAKYKRRDALKATSYVFAQTIPEYSHVCTYTHGGSYAAFLMEKYKDNNDIHNELTRIIHISLTSTCVPKENYFMSYEFQPNFKEYFLAMRDARKITY